MTLRKGSLTEDSTLEAKGLTTQNVMSNNRVQTIVHSCTTKT